MIVIKVKDGESIDRALRRYKKKHRDVQISKELSRRRFFLKPSAKRRHEVLKATYKNKMAEKRAAQ